MNPFLDILYCGFLIKFMEPALHVSPGPMCAWQVQYVLILWCTAVCGFA